MSMEDIVPGWKDLPVEVQTLKRELFYKINKVCDQVLDPVLKVKSKSIWDVQPASVKPSTSGSAAKSSKSTITCVDTAWLESSCWSSTEKPAKNKVTQVTNWCKWDQPKQMKLGDRDSVEDAWGNDGMDSPNHSDTGGWDVPEDQGWDWDGNWPKRKEHTLNWGDNSGWGEDAKWGDSKKVKVSRKTNASWGW